MSNGQSRAYRESDCLVLSPTTQLGPFGPQFIVTSYKWHRYLSYLVANHRLKQGLTQLGQG